MKRWYEEKYPPKMCEDCNQEHVHIPHIKGYAPVEFAYEIEGQWDPTMPNFPVKILFLVEATMPPYTSQYKSILSWN